MSYRLLGAVLIIAGCGGFGINLVLTQKHQEGMIRKLMAAISFMEQELQYRLTPLPVLLKLASQHAPGEVGSILNDVSRELSTQVLPDVMSCLQKVLQAHPDLPRPFKHLLRKLGLSLGNFDLAGQLQGLQEVKDACSNELKKMEEGKSQRFRSYETLGFCTGLALAILLI